MGLPKAATILVGLGLLQLTAPLTARQPAATVRAVDLATDLTRALLVHDTSIEALRWHQVARQEVAGFGDAIYRSDQCFDLRGRWSANCRDKLFSRPDKAFVESASHVIFDGSRFQTLEPASMTGLISDYRGQRRTMASVDCWLGRHVDVSGHKRLGDILIAAKNLRVSGYSQRSLPVVAATAQLDELIAIIEVEIDKEHGFAPRSIVVRDSGLRIPYYRYETHTFIQLDGIWLPSTGTVETRKFAPSPAIAAKLHEVLERHNLSRQSDFFDPAVETRYASALREVFGTDEAVSLPLVAPIRVEFQYDCVNCPTEEKMFVVTTPIGYGILDEFTNRFKAAGSAEWKNPNGTEP